MDCTSIQHQHATTAWRKFRAIIKPRAPTFQPSPKTALVALGLLNIPATAAYYRTRILATRRALQTWPSSWNARWIAHYFPNKTDSLRADHVSSHVRGALWRLTSNLALSPLTLTENRYWTLLTSNFAHFNLSRLLGNLFALRAIGRDCARVPGMTAAHVFGLALSTGLTTSVYMLYRLRAKSSWKVCGFSAILCALTSVAALGARGAEPDEPGRVSHKAMRVWMVALVQLASDCSAALPAGGSRGAARPRGGKTKAVEFNAHLLGWACGAVYYAIFLRPQNRSDGREGEGREASGEQAGDVDEVRRRGLVEGSVKESEDWEEIASKLGYDASAGET